MTVTPCGTDAGYRRHLAKGEDCKPCREAHSDYARLRRAELSPLHGTPRGLRLHQRFHSPVCDLCLYMACADEAARRARFYSQMSVKRKPAA